MQGDTMVNFALVMQMFALLNPLSSFPVLMAAYKKKLDVRGIASVCALAPHSR